MLLTVNSSAGLDPEIFSSNYILSNKNSSIHYRHRIMSPPVTVHTMCASCRFDKSCILVIIVSMDTDNKNLTKDEIIDDLREFAEAEAEAYGGNASRYTITNDPYLENEDPYEPGPGDPAWPSPVSIKDDLPSKNRNRSKQAWMSNLSIKRFLSGARASGYGDMIEQCKQFAMENHHPADSMLALRIMQALRIWGLGGNEAVLVDMRTLIDCDEVMDTAADYSKTAEDVINALTARYNDMVSDEYVSRCADEIKATINVDTEYMKKNLIVYDGIDEKEADEWIEKYIAGKGIPWHIIEPRGFNLLTFYLVGLDDLHLALEYIEDMHTPSREELKDPMHALNAFITSERVECIVGAGSDAYIDKNGMVSYFNMLGEYPVSLKGLNAIIGVVISRFTELPDEDSENLDERGKVVLKTVLKSLGKD